MKAAEVLRRYANGERDFRGVNLRGQSFKGQDLSEADFSDADIRGADFTSATLRQTRFVQARAGVQKRWLIVQQLVAFVVSGLSGFLSALSGALIEAIISDSFRDGESYVIARIVSLVLLGTIFLAILSQGFTFRAFVMSAVAVAFAVAVAVAVVGVGEFAVAIAVAVAVAVAVAFTVAVAVAFTVVGPVAVAYTITVAVAVAVAVAGKVVDPLANPYAGLSPYAGFHTALIAFGFAVANTLLGLYIAWRSSEGDEKLALVPMIGIAISAIGGTAFCGADLTQSDFSKALLKGANFANGWRKDSYGNRRERETVLEWVCWHDAQKFDRARVGSSILANRAVRDLLVNRDGYKKSYVDAKLRGANLNGVNLEQADLTWADLSCATLRQANLKDANLSESLVLNTDFTGAYMTGVCLEAWNINSQTILDRVDCQYVYLLRNHQERRPSSGDFAPGEFTKLYQEVLSTVDLIFRNGVDWKAFVTAFQQVQVQNEATPLEVQSIENKGDGFVVVRVSTSPDANKEKIHSEFNQQYELALQALEAKYRAELQARDSEIAIYREQSVNMWGVINSLANRPINVQAIAEAKAMNESTDQSQNFNVGGNFNITASGNATVALRDLSGIVTNTLQQLPDAVDSSTPSLKELLVQIQAYIEQCDDNLLKPEDKALALEQVKELAEASQKPEPEKQTLGRRALTFLRGTVAAIPTALPAAATLVEGMNKLIPAIAGLLGL